MDQANACNNLLAIKSDNLENMYNIEEVLYYIIGSIGVISNLMVIIVIATNKNLQQKLINKYFLNQSGIDLCASITLIISNMDVNPDYTGPYGQFVCKFWTSDVMLWSVLTSSTYNLVVTSLDRYFQVVHQSWYKKTMTKTNSRLMFAFAWISGFIWNVPMIVSTSGVIDGVCYTVGLWPSVEIQHAVGILGILVQYFIPLGILIFAYARILMTLKKANASTAGTIRASVKGQQNVIKTLLSVSLVFLLCWTANQLIFLYFNFGGDIDFDGYLYHISVILVFTNTCINPFVYLLRYKQCRSALANVFIRNQVSAQVVDTSDPRTEQLS